MIERHKLGRTLMGLAEEVLFRSNGQEEVFFDQVIYKWRLQGEESDGKIEGESKCSGP